MTRPSVLLVHNRYQESGGEDAVFEAEAALLEEHGHPVSRLVFDNRDIPRRPSLSEKASLAASTIWSTKAAARVREVLRAHRPDIAHFHNTLPLVSPAAYAACRREGVAVVQTLHNYRLVCPNGLLFRDGRPCEDCIGRAAPLPAVAHACYRGSRLQSATVAAMLTLHRLRGTWRNDVDLYLAPSEFLRRKMTDGGLPADRIAVKPNFLAPDPGERAGVGGYALFVGRLTASKGVQTLLDAWQRLDLPLRVAGAGPLAPAVERAAAASAGALRYLGHLSRSEVLLQMKGARFLVFSSLWYENFPVTIVEAFACGLPVVAAGLGATAEIVADGRTGVHFAPGNARDLAAKASWAWSRPSELQQLGQAARQEFLERYTPERAYSHLKDLYGRVLATPGVAIAATARA